MDNRQRITITIADPCYHFGLGGYDGLMKCVVMPVLCARFCKTEEQGSNEEYRTNDQVRHHAHKLPDPPHLQ